MDIYEWYEYIYYVPIYINDTSYYVSYKTQKKCWW